MDYDKLIEQLNARGLGNGSSLGYHCGLFDEASTALEASWHENQALRGLINGLDAELSHVRADLARVTAERDAAVKKYEAEKEDFLDYALSGTRNAAPFCTNRHPDCVDKRGWCIPVKCHGFSRDEED